MVRKSRWENAQRLVTNYWERRFSGKLGMVCGCTGIAIMALVFYLEMSLRLPGVMVIGQVLLIAGAPSVITWGTKSPDDPPVAGTIFLLAFLSPTIAVGMILALVAIPFILIFYLFWWMGKGALASIGSLARKT